MNQIIPGSYRVSRSVPSFQHITVPAEPPRPPGCANRRRGISIKNRKINSKFQRYDLFFQQKERDFTNISELLGFKC